MNKKLKDFFVYLTAITALNGATAPAFAGSKNTGRLKPVTAYGAVANTLSFHRNGYYLQNDVLDIAGPVEFSNMGTYGGKGAAFEVLYKEGEVKSAKNIIMKAARKANPHFNHSDLESVLSEVSTNPNEVSALQKALGNPDSLVTKTDISRAELGKILSSLYANGKNKAPFIVRYTSKEGESGLWVPRFDYALTKRWLTEQPKPVTRNTNTIIEKKGLSWTKALLGAVVIGATTGVVSYLQGEKHGQKHPTNPSNGTMTGADTF